MAAWIEGQKAEATLIRPVTVNLTMQHVVERPRRASDFRNGFHMESANEYIIKYGSCFRLGPEGLYPGRIGWCRWFKRWLMGFECETCPHSGERTV